MADTTKITFEIANDHKNAARTGQMALDSEEQLKALLAQFVQGTTAITVAAAP